MTLRLAPLRRRLLAAILVVGTVVALTPVGTAAGAAAGAAAAEAPDVAGRAAILVEAGTGQVLFARNPDEPLPIASTTKIMTALIAVEKGDLDDVVTVSRRASQTTGSRVFLDEGERQTLRDLLYALLLESGNDAAVAIAEHIAGSEEGFAVLMNRRARELGAANTSFHNPHGLPAAGHHSTARDLALITGEALKHPLIAEIVATRSHRIPWPAKSSMKELHNRNRLLYQGIETVGAEVTGVKTGYTSEAGYCLVFSAGRDGRILMGVILASQAGQVFTDARRLLDFGFNAYEMTELVRAGDPMGAVVKDGRAVPLVAVRGLGYSLPRGSSAQEVSKQVELRSPIVAPISAGEFVGVARVVWKGEELGLVPLATVQSLEPPGIELSDLSKWWWLSVLGVIVSLWLRRAGGWGRGGGWPRRRSGRRRHYGRVLPGYLPGKTGYLPGKK